MIILGCDPGLHGALAALSSDGAVKAITDMPTLRLGGKGRREVDPHALARIVYDAGAGHAYVERVSAMPGQGVASMFSFGRSFGTLLGVLAAVGVPTTLATPQSWKKVLGIPAGKDGARARASQLLPAAAHHWPLVKHHGRAEAALIALHGLRELGGPR